MRRFAMVVALACAACGSSESNPSTLVTGTGASPFVGVDARSYVGLMFVASSNGSAYSGSSISVDVTPVAARCVVAPDFTTEPGSVPPPCEEGTSVIITVSSGTTDPIAPGTYALGGLVAEGDPTPLASVARAHWLTVDSTCAMTYQLATGGTVTFSVISDTEVSGTVDVTLADGTTLTGSFAAPICKYGA